MKIIVHSISSSDSELFPVFEGNRFEDVDRYMLRDASTFTLIGSLKERQAYLGWLVIQKPNARLSRQFKSLNAFKRAQKRHSNLGSRYLIQLV